MRQNYKEDSPINTIAKIRNILSDLNVINYEPFWGNPYEGIYSVRVESLESEGNFGTNGKGRNRLYALASGYAEYMERIQNGVLTGPTAINRRFLNYIKKQTGFYFYPDEKFISEDEFRRLPKEYLDDLFGGCDKDYDIEISLYFDRLKENGFKGVLSVPFYDYNNNSIIHLPYNICLMISGSNGMAAGNSMPEGTFQALSELIERYAGSLVYFNRITPPSIPQDYLEIHKEEYEIIKKIESNDFKVIIKDFSCGIGLPAIGVIIIDEKKKKYKLNTGAETSFKIALSRVLTEVHQGISDVNKFRDGMLSLPEKEHDYFLNEDTFSKSMRFLELRKYTINGSGVFPYSLFSNEESYKFNPEVFCEKENYIDEVKSIIDKLTKLGHNIYMRDVSFLGFPSFYIYIPQISSIGRKTVSISNENIDLITNVSTDRIEDLFFPFEDILKDNLKIRELISLLEYRHEEDSDESLSPVLMKHLLKLEFDNKHYWSELTNFYFLTLLAFIVKDYKASINYLNLYIKYCDLSETEYFDEVLYYFELLDRNESFEFINNKISKEIIETFKDNISLFSQIELPKCPNCDSCALIKSCKTSDKINYSMRIINNMKKTTVNQLNFEILRG
jgi:YcaO-like protein with predicted kinase domain